MMLPFWQSAYAAEEAPPAAEQASMVNINSASAEQLSEQLTGIGEKRAAAIIAYRDANGPFSSIEQLLEVKGVGEKVLQKNRGKLTVK
ncbi:MAG: helix-hairpin-helix domain-containing protein [Gammaproteobacteria bacterium]|nr:MAG: helix-hairpin-helix domain-containing protein [Gammaproteobacteria bacterium]